MPQKRKTPRKVAKWEDLPLILGSPDVCLILNESRETVRKLFVRGEIPGKLIGGKWKVSRDLFRNYMEGGNRFEEEKVC